MVTGIEALFQGFLRRNPLALPVFVLHPESSTSDVDAANHAVVGIEAEICQELEDLDVPCALVEPEPPDGRAPARVQALHIVQELGGKKLERGRNQCVKSGPWEGGHSWYHRYAFPRSELLSVMEDAVKEQGDHTDPADLLQKLNSKGWRPGGTRVIGRIRDETRDATKPLVVLLVALAVALVTNRPWGIVLGAMATAVVGAVALSVLAGKAPVFLGLRPEVRWFLRTTYLNQGPGAEWGDGRRRPHLFWPPGTVRQRLEAVARDIRESGLLDNAEPGTENENAQIRHLQLRVHALLEDLRDAHRPWALDLRGRKRPAPPVLVLHRANQANGRVELIKAISDIRSIRSELDPLMVIATSRYEDLGDLNRSVTARRATTGNHPPRSAADLGAWYADWNRSRRVNQSPSLEGSTLPWVLRVPLPDAWLREPEAPGFPRPYDRRGTGARRAFNARQPLWTWLWSLPALAVLLASGAVGAKLQNDALAHDYCEGSLLGVNRDSVSVPAANGEGTECVGVATGTVEFPAGKEIQSLIKEANDEIGDDEHVTIVYAGPLSGSESQLVKGVEELRGVYIAQRANNEESGVKVRVLVANGGEDMHAQSDMAERIAALARDDESIVGVVGMGRNMSDSGKVQTMFRQIDLPVVSTTNSDTDMSKDHSNFFGLAATDEWQMKQLRPVAENLSADRQKERVVVLARDPGESNDRYTQQQKYHGTKMLESLDYQVVELSDYDLHNGKPVLGTQIDQICQQGKVPRAIFFAGRAEDVPKLMNDIGLNPKCNNSHITLFSGDDLAKANFRARAGSLPDNVTVYHLTLTALKEAWTGSLFYGRLTAAVAAAKEDGKDKGLGLGANTNYASEELADGQTASAHDATQALFTAATRGDGQTAEAMRKDGPHSRAETWANLRRTDISHLATGRINFTDTDADGDRLYAYSLVKVTDLGSKNYACTVLAARAAGVEVQQKVAEACP